MAKPEISVSLTKNGNVLFTTINIHGEYNLIELSHLESEEVLYNLHSIVMTLRGQALPPRYWKRRWKRFFSR